MSRKISVLMAVYNGEAFIQEAVQSVLQQTYANWELIIVDNGSTDRTVGVCENLVELDSRIKMFMLPEKGKNKAYNYAYENSTGEIICFFAADDVLVPDSLATRAAGIGIGGVNFSTCCLQTFSDDPAHDGIVFPKDRSQPNYSGGSIMFSRDLAEKIFPLPVSQPNEDTWTSLHLRAFGINSHVPVPLYLYRIHHDNSYGYGLSFEEKRVKYLHRMAAFRVFYEKWEKENVTFLKSEVVPFLAGLALAEQYKRFAILFVPRLNVRSKLLLIFYCSPRLYYVRNKYFKYLSGFLS